MSEFLYKSFLQKIISLITGVTLLAGIGALPIVPSAMQYLRSYCYPSKDAQMVMKANSSATSSLATAYNIKTVYSDIDGDGWVCNAVFGDSNSNLVVVQIPHSQYLKLAYIKGGEQFNPTKTQFTNIFNALASPAQAAIVRDATSSSGVITATTQSWPQTITGSNPVLFVYGKVRSTSATNLQLMTYNGTQMATTTKVASYNDGQWSWMMQLANPSTGTHNIVALFDSSLSTTFNAADYTGAAQTGIPDSSNTSGGAAGSDTYSLSTTVVASNAWLLLASIGLDGACSGITGQGLVTNKDNPITADSNGTVGTGSQSITVTGCGNRVEGKIIVSIAPFVAVPSGTIQPLIIIQDE